MSPDIDAAGALRVGIMELHPRVVVPADALVGSAIILLVN